MVKKRGYRPLKTKSVPAKADINAQIYFLNNILLPLLEKALCGHIKVFFADGVHLIYGYSGEKCWCRERVQVPSAYGRKRVNCLGFMDAVSHKTETVMNGTYLNAGSVCEGLELLRKNNPDDIIYVILDNAAYQRCVKVKNKAESLKINLVFLPPYSPNLNLIERLWKFLRKKIIANKYYLSFENFFNSVKDFINSVHSEFSSELSSLLSFNFELLDSPI